MGRSTSKSSSLLEIGADHLLLEEAENADEATLERKICFPEDDRLFFLAAALRRGQTIEQLHEKTKIDLFFLYKLSKTIELENRIKENPQNQEILAEAKQAGFSDAFLATCWNVDEQAIYDLRKAQNLFPVYKMVDTCAAEFESTTPYFYSTYEEENESTRSAKESVIVLGSGPIRIGQGWNSTMRQCIQCGPFNKRAMKQLSLIIIQKQFRLTLVSRTNFTLSL